MIRNGSAPRPGSPVSLPENERDSFSSPRKENGRIKVSVVILNWNGRALLDTFLPSVVRHTPQEYAEIIVADNGSTDDSADFVRTRFPEVKWLPLGRNYGFAGGYNRALAQLDSPCFLLLNSDAEVSENWLPPLLAMLGNDEKTAAVMPKIRSYRQRTRFEYAGAAGGLMDRYGFPYCRGRILNDTEEDRGQWDEPAEIFWASGAALLVRSDLYRIAGGLDEDYFAHMEEIDLCWRLKNLGYKIMVQPASTVYHLGGGTLGNESPRKLFLNFRNSLYTLYKNLPEDRLFSTLFLRMCMDGAIAVLYLLQGHPARFAAVVKAHRAFYRHLAALRDKRRQTPKGETFPPAGMLDGSLLWKRLRKKL